MPLEERVTKIEEVFAEYMRAQARELSLIRSSIAGIHAEVAEIKASNARTDAILLEMQQQAERDRQQAERDRKDFNRRLAELSDSMGTLIEDMVAPCGFRLARTVFGNEEAHECSIRVRRKHPTLPGEMMELDLLALGPSKALVIEVKRRFDAAKCTEWREKLNRFSEFFPEYAGKNLLPAVASVYLDEALVRFLNREKIYGIAMGDETMEVVNAGAF